LWPHHTARLAAACLRIRQGRMPKPICVCSLALHQLPEKPVFGLAHRFLNGHLAMCVPYRPLPYALPHSCSSGSPVHMSSWCQSCLRVCFRLTTASFLPQGRNTMGKRVVSRVPQTLHRRSLCWSVALRVSMSSVLDLLFFLLLFCPLACPSDVKLVGFLYGIWGICLRVCCLRMVSVLGFATRSLPSGQLCLWTWLDHCLASGWDSS